MKLKMTALSMAIALGFAASPALAQQDYGQGQQQQQQGQQHQDPAMGQQQQHDFSDSDLHTFVDLQSDIGEIRDEYVSRIESAGSEDEARQLQQEAQTEMVSAIEEVGMTVQDYNAIAVAYNSDPEIQQRVDALSDS